VNVTGRYFPRRGGNVAFNRIPLRFKGWASNKLHQPPRNAIGSRYDPRSRVRFYESGIIWPPYRPVARLLGSRDPWIAGRSSGEQRDIAAAERIRSRSGRLISRRTLTSFRSASFPSTSHNCDSDGRKLLRGMARVTLRDTCKRWRKTSVKEESARS